MMQTLDLGRRSRIHRQVSQSQPLGLGLVASSVDQVILGGTCWKALIMAMERIRRSKSYQKWASFQVVRLAESGSSRVIEAIVHRPV